MTDQPNQVEAWDDELDVVEDENYRQEPDLPEPDEDKEQN